MSANTDTIQHFYAAINGNDLHALTRYFHPEIVRIEPQGFPSAGTYRGAREVQEHVAKGRGSWAEGSCEPEQILENGQKVVACVHVSVRLHGSKDRVEGNFADGFLFRDGKILEYHTFGQPSEAFSWAGIQDPEVN